MGEQRVWAANSPAPAQAACRTCGDFFTSQFLSVGQAESQLKVNMKQNSGQRV